MSDHEHDPNLDSGPLYKPAFIKFFLWFLYLACAGAAAAGFIWKKDHPHFALEGFPVFFALYGFIMFVLIVLVGQHLRKLVGRKEGYYLDRE